MVILEDKHTLILACNAVKRVLERQLKGYVQVEIRWLPSFDDSVTHGCYIGSIYQYKKGSAVPASRQIVAKTKALRAETKPYPRENQ